MHSRAIEDVLDEASRWLAKGYDAEYVAKQFPEHTDQLYSLLLVMECLRDLRTDADITISQAEPALESIDWDALCEPQPVY